MSSLRLNFTVLTRNGVADALVVRTRPHLRHLGSNLILDSSAIDLSAQSGLAQAVFGSILNDCDNTDS